MKVPWWRGLMVGMFCLALACPAFGWDEEGHMMVAALAYQRLTPAKRQRVAELLKLNPDYSAWLSRISPGTSAMEREEMLFMLAATWPDQIRHHPGYHDDGEHSGELPDGASSRQNLGYQDKLHHKYWHFVNRPFSQDGTPLGKAPSPNAQTQVAAFRRAIAGDAPDEVKSYDLVWLLHLVGDVHQPLHCSDRYTRTSPGGDAGGNKVELCRKPCREELHGFWDDLLGRSDDLVVALRTARELPKADPRSAANLDEAAWVEESFHIAQESVYVTPIGLGEGPFTLTTAYRENSRKIAEQRAALAGARLGAVINSELK